MPNISESIHSKKVNEKGLKPCRAASAIVKCLYLHTKKQCHISSNESIAGVNRSILLAYKPRSSTEIKPINK